MPLLLRCLIVLIVLLPVSHGRADEWKAEIKDAEIPMRDGATLAADIYLPAKPGKYPAVLIQTPYNKAHMGAVLNDNVLPASEAGRGSNSDMQVLMDRERYVYVAVDWRGFYGSKAALAKQKFGWRRGQDGFDSVEWIAGQSWSNGKVGTWGGSAPGRQQLDTAVEHPPHLVCCVPLIAPMGHPYDMFYAQGVLFEAYVRTLDRLGFGVSKKALAAADPDLPVWKLAEASVKKIRAIEVPCLFITGWWDNYPDHIIRSFEDLLQNGGEKARQHSHLLIGPWDHVSIGVVKQGEREFPAAEKESGRLAKVFLDRWLLDKEDERLKSPQKVRFWQIGEEKWLEAKDWSSVPRQTQTFYLTASGKLAAERGETAARTYRYDPADSIQTLGGANLPPLKHGPTDHSSLSQRKDVLAYSTAELAAPLRLCGSVALVFDASINRPDCNFTAWLCEVTPSGKAWHLGDTACRAKFMTAGRTLAKPGEKFRVQLQFPAMAATIQKGHQLRVYLSSSNHSRYARNSNTGADQWDEKTAVDVEVSILHDNAKLEVPTLKE